MLGGRLRYHRAATGPRNGRPRPVGTGTVRCEAVSQPLVCARPGCGGAAAAWLTYDYSARCLWLDDEPSCTGDHWGLCARHAARMTPPRGWDRVDRRRVLARRDPPTSLAS